MAAGAKEWEQLRTMVPHAASGSARYVLELSGARLEFGDDAAVMTLRRVIEALRR